MFHPLDITLTSEELPKEFPTPFNASHHPLVAFAAKKVQHHVSTSSHLSEWLQHGKMLGVLLMSTTAGEVGFLAAFSGTAPLGLSDDYFVPSVFDASLPDGYFKQEERNITALNGEIAALRQSDAYLSALAKRDAAKAEMTQQLLAGKQFLKEEKLRRDGLRAEGVSAEQEVQLLNESRFQKAEYKRLGQRLQQALNDCEQKVKAVEAAIETLQQARKERSQALQQWLFEHYVLCNGLGESQSVLGIFDHAGLGLPPAATGDCAGPKLLQAAYLNHYRPLAMGEFWIGLPDLEGVHSAGFFYPSCESKCRPLLTYMLQGVDLEDEANAQEQSLTIVYEDDDLLVVDKPSGILSVPGKGSQLNVEEMLKAQFGKASYFKAAHRLDMDTSGLLIVAKREEVLRALHRQFAAHQVKKYYVSLLEGVVPVERGEVSLPLCANHTDRPRQMVSEVHGKPALTRYEVIARYGSRTLVRFEPLTGRTHQLRIHAAHPLGLNAPICGDRLYGTMGNRLCLHAEQVTFTHPTTGETVTLKCEANFPMDID